MAAYAAKQLAARAGRHPRGRGRRDRRAAARLRPRLPDQGLQRRVAGAVRLPGRRRRPRHRRPSARCCAARTAGCPTWCTPTPAETIAEAVHILQEYGVSQMPVVRAEPPIVAAEVAGRSPSGPCSTRSSPAPPGSPTRSRTTCPPPLPTIGSTEPAERRGQAARGRRRGAGPGGRQAGRRAHPAGPAGLPRPRLTPRRPRGDLGSGVSEGRGSGRRPSSAVERRVGIHRRPA